MKTVWKYALDPTPVVQRIMIPKDAQILDVQIQNGVPTLWALVRTDVPSEEREIHLIGTGNQVSVANLRYISTHQTERGIRHVFVTIPPTTDELFHALLAGETLYLTRQQWLDVKPMFKYTQLLSSEADGLLACRAENRSLEKFCLLTGK